MVTARNPPSPLRLFFPPCPWVKPLPRIIFTKESPCYSEKNPPIRYGVVVSMDVTKMKPSQTTKQRPAQACSGLLKLDMLCHTIVLGYLYQWQNHLLEMIMPLYKIKCFHRTNTVEWLLNLQDLTLVGNGRVIGFPPEIGLLVNLKNLQLYNVQLTGHIPNEIGQLTNLRGLYLENNRLEGPIPSEIRNLNELEVLDLRHNRLNGAIPWQIGCLTKLRELHLAFNHFQGSIPVELGNLFNNPFGDDTSHAELCLYDNQLSGELPLSIIQMKMRGVRVNLSNNAGFTLPSNVGELNFEGFGELDLSRCSLKGVSRVDEEMRGRWASIHRSAPLPPILPSFHIKKV
jgi:hypothetical protein